MSILEKSEKIGNELRNTPEGATALELFNQVSKSPKELTVELFKLINRYYIQMHFYSIPQAIGILEGNINNPILGDLVKRILAIESLKAFGEANVPIGKFVDDIGKLAFSNSVKYQLPKDIAFTPELVRLSNSLTVECLRTSLLQQFIREYKTKPRFIEAVKRFDELRGTKPMIPYSKEDRKCLSILRKEYTGVCSVDLIYSLVSLLTYIKSMIFDSFYNNIFEVYEKDEVVSRKQKKLNHCTFVKLILLSPIKILDPSSGWILKLHNTDGSISYAQIFQKTTHFSPDTCTTTLKALIHDIL